MRQTHAPGFFCFRARDLIREPVEMVAESPCVIRASDVEAEEAAWPGRVAVRRPVRALAKLSSIGDRVPAV